MIEIGDSIYLEHLKKSFTVIKVNYSFIIVRNREELHKIHIDNIIDEYGFSAEYSIHYDLADRYKTALKLEEEYLSKDKDRYMKFITSTLKEILDESRLDINDPVDFQEKGGTLFSPIKIKLLLFGLYKDEN